MGSEKGDNPTQQTKRLAYASIHQGDDEKITR